MSDKKTVSTERKIQTYPAPKYFGLIQAMSKCDAISRSKVVNIAVKKYFDSMPAEERERIIQNSKNTY